MSQVRKLYKFYFRKIWQKNWLRITIVSLFLVGCVWFGFPYLLFRASKKASTNWAESRLRDPDINEEQRQRLQNQQRNIEETTFHNWNKGGFGADVEWEINRSLLEKKIKRFEERKKAGDSETVLEKIKSEIEALEMVEASGVGNLKILLFNADNSFFFKQNEKYGKGKNFWKLLNDISLWNLTGFIFLFWLVFNVLDNVFSEPKKDGEETMVLSFTPGVKRSELFFGKVLAFLTFYSIINTLLFLLPYGFYYFWVAEKVSALPFILLSLYTTVIGPILFFGLVLVPYIYLNSWIRFLGIIISSLVAFLPTIWYVLKTKMFPLHVWPYKLENWLFNPIWFTIISLICGTLFLALHHKRYQKEDLG